MKITCSSMTRAGVDRISYFMISFISVTFSIVASNCNWFTAVCVWYSKVKGSEEEIANAFRATRDEIRDYSKKFIEENIK